MNPCCCVYVCFSQATSVILKHGRSHGLKVALQWKENRYGPVPLVICQRSFRKTQHIPSQVLASLKSHMQFHWKIFSIIFWMNGMNEWRDDESAKPSYLSSHAERATNLIQCVKPNSKSPMWDVGAGFWWNGLITCFINSGKKLTHHPAEHYFF